MSDAQMFFAVWFGAVAGCATTFGALWLVGLFRDWRFTRDVRAMRLARAQRKLAQLRERPRIDIPARSRS
ncbi:MAG: hypothetical protein KGK07_12895 [Chloroflexota bacterium]|nr:hypothetical protein [Chloroflexota bacterium]